MKTRKFPFAIYSKEPDSDIVLVEFAKNLKVDILIAEELVASRLEFMENKKHYVIIDVSNVKEVTAEAKIYMQSTEGGLKDILAGAFIASNHISALLANVFAKTPNVISKFLPNQAEALLWINKIKEDTFFND